MAGDGSQAGKSDRPGSFVTLEIHRLPGIQNSLTSKVVPAGAEAMQTRARSAIFVGTVFGTSQSVGCFGHRPGVASALAVKVTICKVTPEVGEMMIGHLEDVLLVLDMIDLLETDDVVEGEDLEGEEVGGGLVATEANPGKGSYGGNIVSFV